jgi:L-lactate dehydrogenase (cytochrome)
VAGENRLRPVFPPRDRNVGEFECRASRRLPGPIWHYLQGGADDEWTLARNSAAFDEVALIPDVLVDVSRIDPSAEFLGRRHPLPLVLSPTGMSLLFHPEGELAVARAAAAEGLLYALSTMATTTIEAVAQAAGPRMFQLYWFKDRQLTVELLNRAEAAGYSSLCLTVDTHVAGNRERDLATGMTLPPRFTLRSLLDFTAHPRWALPYLLGRRFDLANVVSHAPSVQRNPTGVISYVNAQMDRSVSWKDLAWLRDRWSGALLVKGVSSPADAARAAAAGCDGVMISNHGGRQLDGSVSPVEQLPAIRDAVGPGLSLIVDGGVRRGVHVLKAIALGADACSIGRPYLYGLAVDGERGVRRIIQIFREEIERGMTLMGCPTLKSLSPRHLSRVLEATAAAANGSSTPRPSLSIASSTPRRREVD